MEGLPVWVTNDNKADPFFGSEQREVAPVYIPFRSFRVLSEDDEVEIIRDGSRVVMKCWKGGDSITHLGCLKQGIG